MESPTDHYSTMQRKLSEADKLVKDVDPIECKTDLQKLKLRGYILITHSILEEYLENLCKEVAIEAKCKFVGSSQITKALLALISSNVIDCIREKSRTKVLEDVGDKVEIFSEEAVNTQINRINNNHGITVKDQKNLFLPIGIDIATSLSENLHQFGKKRGDVAHSYNTVQHENTLSDIKSRLRNIVTELREVDELACSACTP